MELSYKLVLNELALGKSVQLIGKGNSMDPLIKDKESVMIEPYTDQQLEKGMVVFVRINHNRFLTHQIVDIVNTSTSTYIIGNLAKKIDGPVTKDAIYGIITKIGKDDSFTGLTVIE